MTMYQATVEAKILEYCVEERTAKEITEYLGYKSVCAFRNNYLKPLAVSGKIKMSIPDKPTSKKQKYITI